MAPVSLGQERELSAHSSVSQYNYCLLCPFKNSLTLCLCSLTPKIHSHTVRVKSFRSFHHALFGFHPLFPHFGQTQTEITFNFCQEINPVYLLHVCLCNN